MAKLARWVAALHVLALIVHMSAAVAFVSGLATAYFLHARLTWVVLGLGIVQALAVLSPAIPRLHGMYKVFVVLVVLGEVLELFVIPRGYYVYHVSVAMVVWGCAMALYVRLLDPEWTTANAVSRTS